MKPEELANKAIKRKALQKSKELVPLIKILMKRKINVATEIGTYKGGTLYLLCELSSPNATIISIDKPGGKFGGGYTQKELAIMKKYRKRNQKIYFIRGDSQSLKTKKDVLNILNRKKLDLLIIDGDHTYSGVKKDWELYSTIVKKSGLIIFHDIIKHPKVPECQVYKFWDEIKKKYDYKEFIDRNDDVGWGQWGGIGIIYYKTQK